MATPIVPPIKIQGIKTKIVPKIHDAIEWDGRGRWIEPFLGSGVVLFNVLPERASVSDINPHIINFYRGIQSGDITALIVREYLEEEGHTLSKLGEEHYYAIRERFNKHHSSLDFLYLNRACFNGLLRFNKGGNFNTPFCRKRERFSKSYITKICGQVQRVQDIVCAREWIFECKDWKEVLKDVSYEDFLYVDPPYYGRSTDYYNQWSYEEAVQLEQALQQLPCKFILSMWAENSYRKNERMYETFSDYKINHIEHFYHVGSKETLRGNVTEALVIK